MTDFPHYNTCTPKTTPTNPTNPTKRPPAMFAVFFKVLTELIHQRKQAMLWFPVFLGIGIAIYFSLQTEPHLPILITLLIIGLTLVAIACLWAHPLRWLFVLCAWVILGVLVSSLRTNLVSAPILGWRYYGTMTGTVIGIDRSSKDPHSPNPNRPINRQNIRAPHAQKDTDFPVWQNRNL